MILSEKYLDPVSSSLPCGSDLCYDQAFLDLQVRVRGKEETQFAAGEGPNWREVLDNSLALTERFKHLQVGVILTLALLQTGGLPGFRDGLQLLRGWIDRYWETIYPPLDAEDNQDPTERINILQCLSVTTMGDPYRFCDRLSQAILCESKTLGRFTLEMMTNGSDGAGSTVDSAQITAAFRDSPAEELQARYQALTESLAALEEMESLLMEKVGAGHVPNFEMLRKRLIEMRGFLAPHVAAPVVDHAVLPPSSSSPAQATGKGSFPGAPKAIESREDVLAALRAICDYYQSREPSSPVPFLLQRAQRLVNMDFLQIMNDLAPEALPQMKAITGAPEVKPDNT